jgi:Flp pilus assembly protein TadD
MVKIETRTKTDIIKQHMRAGDLREAIRVAARLQRLDKHRNAILDAQGAYTNPRFYIQIGKAPDALIEAGRLALVDRFGE